MDRFGIDISASFAPLEYNSMGVSRFAEPMIFVYVLHKKMIWLQYSQNIEAILLLTWKFLLSLVVYKWSHHANHEHFWFKESVWHIELYSRGAKMSLFYENLRHNIKPAFLVSVTFFWCIFSWFFSSSCCCEQTCNKIAGRMDRCGIDISASFAPLEYNSMGCTKYQ